MKKKKIKKSEFQELEMESSIKRERRALQLEIDLTRGKDSQNHRGGLGKLSMELGRNNNQKIFSA